MTTRYEDKGLNSAVSASVQASARYWCDYYNTLGLEELRSVRREGAIKDLCMVLADHYQLASLHSVADYRVMAELIIDNSDWGKAGFDAQYIIPQTWFDRWRTWLRA